MKKLFVLLFAMSLAIVGTKTSYAGSIEYLTNQSADYIRTFSRNAATDAPDVAFYNPAGSTFLKDGLHLNLNTQTIFKTYTITYKEKDYVSNAPTPLLPTLFVLYKKKNFAAFASFTVPAGGGSLIYEKGVPYLIPMKAYVPDGKAEGNLQDMPKEGRFEGSSMFLGGTVGVAYKFFNMVSISASFRFDSAKKTYKGYAVYDTSGDNKPRAELDVEKKAIGYGGTFGLHVRPIKYVELGLRYETATPHKFTNKTTTKNLNLPKGTALEVYSDGYVENKDLPAVFAAGLVVHPINRLALSFSINYYFINQADDQKDDKDKLKGYVKGYDDDYKNGLEFAVAVEFLAIKKNYLNLLVSLGYNRAFPSGNADTYSDFEYALSSHAIGGGVKASILKNRLHLTLAAAKVFYDEGKNTGVHPLISLIDPKAGGETFNKSSFLFSLGIQYSFL